MKESSMLIYKNITMTFGDRTLLVGQTGCIYGGHLVGLMGPNGSGKSILLRILAGVLAPTYGEVWYGDLKVILPHVKKLSRQRAYIPPVLHSHWDVSAHHVFTLGDTPIDHNMIDRLDLGGILSRPFSHLSSGERARVMVGHALARRPRIILADEVTSPLDAAYQDRVMDLLRDYAHQGNVVLVALHQKDLVERYCDYGLEVHSQSLRVLPGHPICLKPVQWS